MKVTYIHLFPPLSPDVLKVEARQEAYMPDVLLDV
jgi:hypothetical protein